MSGSRNGMSRRQFLRRSGLAAAALGVPSLLAACAEEEPEAGLAPDEPAEVDPEALRVGLLVPLVGTYASLGEDMRDAFQLYLDQNDGQLGGRDAQLIVRETEAEPEVGLRAARRLIEDDQAHFVTGIVSSAVALGVRDVFDESGVPLIVSNAGANALTREARSPYIFRTSFTNWQPCFAIGQWAYDNIAQRNFYIIAPDYAAGHEDAVAFREAYVDEAGGEIIDEAFPPFATTEDYQPFISEIERSGAEGVFAFFAGGEAINFVQQYRDFGLKDRIPLIGPGFLTDDGILPAQGDAAVGLRSSMHYTPLLDIPRNQEYAEAFRSAYDKAPTVYSVQSYDAAQLIDLTVGELGGEVEDVDAVVEAMANVGTIDSPRGEFEMDPETHNPVQTFYLREVQEVDGELGNAVVEELGVFADPG